MHIVIAGGTGLLGRALTRRVVADSGRVTILSRHARPDTDRVKQLAWSADGSSGPWAKALEGADAIVNLTGAGIADKRWTDPRKRELRNSRVLSARSLVAAVTACTSRPTVFVQISGVGYYGADVSDRICDETSPAGTDFLAGLCGDWEAGAHPMADLGCRLVIARSGVVLTPEGGALPQMSRPFSFFVGGPVASGRQYLSWIHLDDWINLVLWAIRTPAASGVLNVTSPEPVMNAEFSRALGRTMHRPNWMPVPALALRVLFGELADAVLINGQRVMPARPLALGFGFRYPGIEAALEQLVHST